MAGMKPRMRSAMRGSHSRAAPASGGELEPDVLKSLAHSIATTRPDEIDCDRCFHQIDEFVEMTLAGKDAAEAMPLVRDHLNRCADCCEEFEALLAALQIDLERMEKGE
jgi:hypothetical protein